jgi:EAL domain-containing protein (putative c-di-GMP-specific phosphodiesterase class I)
MSDPEGAVRVLHVLRAFGVRVAIDDFGSGYTSLSQLKQLPVDALKIDRGLVADILENDKDDAIAAAIIGLAHRLGVSVLAEGIETSEVWARLQALGCDEGQGYHLARPLPASELEVWIAARWKAGTNRL